MFEAVSFIVGFVAGAISYALARLRPRPSTSVEPVDPNDT